MAKAPPNDLVPPINPVASGGGKEDSNCVKERQKEDVKLV